jgi:hypothetical protein
MRPSELEAISEMESRTALRGTGVSKQMVVVVVALLAAFVLGAVGGYVLKALSLPAAAVATQVVAGQPAADGPGSAWNYANRRSGTQSFEGPAATSPSSAPSREPATGRTGPQS